MARELKSPAVFGNDTDHIVRNPSRNLGGYLQGHRNPGPNQAGEMGDDFLGVPAGIAAVQWGSKVDSVIKTSWRGFLATGGSTGVGPEPSTMYIINIRM